MDDEPERRVYVSRVGAKKRIIEKPEIYSFLIVVVTMLISALFLPASYYWFFILLALIDGVSTFYRVNLFLALDRVGFAFILLFLSVTIAGAGAAELIAESVALIGILDFSFLLRKVRHTRNDLAKIAAIRLRSYLYSLVPAAVFSIGTVYLYSGIVPTVSSRPIFELGIASVAIFVIVFLLIRLLLSPNSRKAEMKIGKPFAT